MAPESEQWLIWESPEVAERPEHYGLSTLQKDTPLKHLVYLAKLRWRVERDYRHVANSLSPTQRAPTQRTFPSPKSAAACKPPSSAGSASAPLLQPRRPVRPDSWGFQDVIKSYSGSMHWRLWRAQRGGGRGAGRGDPSVWPSHQG